MTLIVYEGAITSDLNEETTPREGGAGRYHVCIIRPGEGSNGRYVSENLAASRHLFPMGTHIYMNHPGRSEREDKTTRDVEDLAGVLVSEAVQGEDGALYADMMIYPSVNPIVKERWKDIGLSVAARIDGRVGPDGVVPAFSRVVSVDLVTKAGAGGGVLEVLESAREDALDEEEEKSLDEAKFNEFASNLHESLKTAFDGLGAQLSAIYESLAEKEAPAAEEAAPAEETKVDTEAGAKAILDGVAVGVKIAEAGLPKAASDRVVKAVSEGADVDEAIEAERNYMKEVRESARDIFPDKESTVVEEAYVVGAFRTGKDN